jgi:hypothetical protein
MMGIRKREGNHFSLNNKHRTQREMKKTDAWIQTLKK